MAAKLAISLSAPARLRRLAVLFAVGIRLKIVAELYMREMSAKQFHAEFGGGELARVTQNFTKLAEEGWLRYIRSEGPGGGRRGAVEHFYRATDPPFMDVETWALLPYSVRTAASWNLFREIALELRADLEARDRAADVRRELSCDVFVLDEEGWLRAVEAVRTNLAQLFEEQEDARRRAEHSGEELMKTDILMIAFQSPDSGGRSAPGDLLVEDSRELLVPFPERLAPILGDEVRRDIVSELNRREISVTQFHREIGGMSKQGISRKFKGLEGGGWVAKGKTMTGGVRRGAKEQFFHATKPAIRNYDLCADRPNPLKKTESWQTFEHLCESVKESMLTGTFDQRTDRCVTWSVVRLDRQGRENVIAGVESLFEFISQEQGLAMRRIARSGEKPIKLTLGLAAFDAMKETIKAP